MVKQQPNRRKKAGRKSTKTSGRSTSNRAMRNGQLKNGQPKKTRAAKSSRARSKSKKAHTLDFKSAMGAIASVASEMAHSAADESRLAGRKVAALWEKGQQSFSRFGTKAKEKLAAGAARGKQWVSPGRSSGKRGGWRNPLAVLVKAVNGAVSTPPHKAPKNDSGRRDNSAAA